MSRFRWRPPLRILQARLAREGLCPPPPPLALTVSVTDSCNARCLTCGLHEQHQRPERLSVADYERIFCAIGRGLHWATITGGEPSLRTDIAQILQALVRHTAPQVITIATNGLWTERVVAMVQAALAVHHQPLVVNLSLDALGAEHDWIRGVAGAWDKAQATYRRLRQLRERHPNLVLGIHTVISQHNVAAYPEICDGLLALEPDSLIAEVAQARAELHTLDQQLSPGPQAYRRAMDHLRQRTRNAPSITRAPARSTTQLIQAFRAYYYDAVASYLEEPRELWPCLAGSASAHLSASGKLWGCGVRCDELGDLSTAGTDFEQIWTGETARRFRQQVREQRCHCTLANAAYLSILGSPRALLRVSATLLRSTF